jgi:hypothetical protein
MYYVKKAFAWWEIDAALTRWEAHKKEVLPK